jgi:DNA-binding GntR family transcriptional regulator
MKETLKQQAYSIIKEKIINCEYPPNMVLNEEKLKEEINASRTPIRDALSRLEQENLVKILPQKGIMVSALSIREINMIHESRMLIEPYAISKYAYKILKERFEQFLKMFSIENIEEQKCNQMYDYDNQLHQEFIDATDNKYLIDIYERIFCQNRRLRILSGVKSENRLIETQREHRRIVECCLDEEWDAAAECMREHLRKSKKASFEAVFKENEFDI